MRVAFVYANPRSGRVQRIRDGLEPDTSLLGENHLAEHGIDAGIVEPALQRRTWRSDRVRRAAWNLRDGIAPFEVRGANVLCASLGPPAALAASVRRGLRIVLFNVNICTRIERAGRVQRALLVAGTRRADAVVCFADAQRDRLVAQTGADPARIHSLPLGVDERFLSPAAPPPRDGYVLAVGRDLARDYVTLAGAVRDLPTRVILVASSRNLVGASLPENVEVRLDATAPELRELYEGARCVAVPTRHESFPFGADCSGQTVLLDAWAMDRPVVASARSTLTGYAEDGVNALLVRAEDPPALRSALDRVLTDDDLARRFGDAGRAAVESRFTTRAFAARLAAVLRSVHPGGG